jgi:hypothetical protein
MSQRGRRAFKRSHRAPTEHVGVVSPNRDHRSAASAFCDLGQFAGVIGLPDGAGDQDSAGEQRALSKLRLRRRHDLTLDTLA